MKVGSRDRALGTCHCHVVLKNLFELQVALLLVFLNCFNALLILIKAGAVRLAFNSVVGFAGRCSRVNRGTNLLASKFAFETNAQHLKSVPADRASFCNR